MPRRRTLAIALTFFGSALVQASTVAAQPSSEDLTTADLARVVGSVSELPPARVRFELQRGQRALAQGVHAQATEAFQRVTQAAPEHPGAWFLLSRSLAGQGQATQARDAASRAVQALEALEPERRAAFDAAAFHFNLALLEIATVDLDAAERSLRRALELGPQSSRTRFQLASILLERGRDREAAAELEAVVKARPDFAPGWLALGKARLRLDDAKGAGEALAEAVRLAPDMAEAQFVLGSVHRATGDLARQQAALSSFEKLRAAEEKRTSARQQVEVEVREAVVAMSEEKWDAAADVLEALLREPEVAESGFHRGRILSDLARVRRQQGRVPEARKLYREALAAEPDSFVASFELGSLLAQEGKVDAALPHLVRATELNPFDYAAHVNLGLAWAGTGRLNDALAEIRKAVTIQPARDELRQLLVDFEWAVGHEDVARSVAALGGVTLPEGTAPPETLQREPQPETSSRPELPWAR